MQQTLQKRTIWKSWWPRLIWVLFIAYACFSALKLVTYPLVFSYQEGTCTITADLTTHNGGTGGNKGRPATFHPNYGFTLHSVDGQTTQTSGFDWFTNPLDSYIRGVEVPRYHVGQTIPCWYNPSQHSQAVLTRTENWGALFFSSTNQAYRLAGSALLIGVILFCFWLSLMLLSPIIKALTPGYWRRTDSALQSLTASPTSPTPSAAATTFPPEVYALAAAHRLGTPVEEYVQPPKHMSFGCLFVIALPLFSLVFMVLATLGLALLASTHAFSVDPLPVWILPLFGFLLIFSLVAGVVIFGLIMGPTLRKREQADMLYRFARAELFYTCTYGLLWIKRGEVVAIYPWNMVYNASTDLDARGYPTASWLFLNDGSRQTLYTDAVPLVQRGLMHYRKTPLVR